MQVLSFEKSVISNTVPLLIASMCACLMAGCGDANRGKIIGTWEIDRADSVHRRVNRNRTGDESQAATDETGSDSATSKMLLQFQRNGQLKTETEMGAVQQEKLGTWKFISFDETSRTMKITCELQSQESEHDVEFLEEEIIQLIPPNMAGTTMKLKFKRQKRE